MITPQHIQNIARLLEIQLTNALGRQESVEIVFKSSAVAEPIVIFVANDRLNIQGIPSHESTDAE